MKHKLFIMLCNLFICCASVEAQDPHFTQFYTNPLYLNPAAAGTGFVNETPAGRVSSNYRNQWPGAYQGSRTFTLGWDQAFDKLHGALGLLYMNDIAGSVITTQSVMANYAARFEIGKDLQLGVGLQGGMVNRSLDYSKLVFGNQIDSNLFHNSGTPAATSITYPNFNGGVLLTGNHFFGGIALFNLLQPNWSFYYNPNEILPRRIAIHAGYKFDIGNSWQLTPLMQYQKQKTATEILLGLNNKIGNLIFGLWFRQTFGQYKNADAFAGSIGYDFKRFRFIYSYDATVSVGRSAIPSSHEISLRYCWKTRQVKLLHCSALN
jgi:type IX secretion system PorP/SprF family membrane protein